MLLGFATAAQAEPLTLAVSEAAVAYDQRNGEPVVSFRFTPDAARAFAAFTANNVGKTMELRFNGQTLMKPVIREPILGGTGQIASHLTVDQAKTIAGKLSAGGAIEVEIAGQ